MARGGSAWTVTSAALLALSGGCAAEGALDGAPTDDATVDATAHDAIADASDANEAAESGGDARDVGVDAPAPCPTTPWASGYTLLPTVGAKTDRPAAEHPDLNAKIRGFTPTTATLGLVDVGGPTDDKAPRLWSLFADAREPAFVATLRVHDWAWDTMTRLGPIASPEVTAVDFATKPGEDLKLPRSGYEIAPGLSARVLFLDGDSITLKYTGEDNIVYGYALHVLDVCIEPKLRDAYVDANAKGRASLPALATGQAFARARGGSVRVIVRDTGAFMDPRVRKDWWPR